MYAAPVNSCLLVPSSLEALQFITITAGGTAMTSMYAIDMIECTFPVFCVSVVLSTSVRTPAHNLPPSPLRL